MVFEWDIPKQIDSTSGPFGRDQRIEFELNLQWLPVTDKLARWEYGVL